MSSKYVKKQSVLKGSKKQPTSKRRTSALKGANRKKKSVKKASGKKNGLKDKGVTKSENVQNHIVIPEVPLLDRYRSEAVVPSH